MIEELDGALRQRFDYWRRWHAHVLNSKGMATSETLWNGLLIDVASSLVAVDELSSTTAVDLIQDLALPPPVSQNILGRVAGFNPDHLGFRIFVPMDVYMEVLPLWVDALRWELIGTKRFAPSARFQDRVGGGAEMAQVWVQTPDGPFQIELFDIHTPLKGDSAHLATVAADLLNHRVGYPGARAWEPLTTDEIWHYGVLLGSTDDVAAVHRELSVTARSGGDLLLLNEDVVINLWHGSHHTKMSRSGRQIEVELLSYVDDWQTGE